MNIQTRVLKTLVAIVLSLDFNAGFAEVVVAYSDFPPLAYEKDKQPMGFSIALFSECAALMDLQCRFVRMPFSEKIKSVASSKVDVAIGGISITSEREVAFDFTTPTLTGGLCCISMVSPSLLPSLNPRAIRLLASLFFFLLAFGHILWFFERGQDAINDKYFPGILESFWCLFATMSTVGYGDIAPKRWAGRIISVFVMLLGISFFGIITASFTTDFLVEARTQSVTNYESIVGLVIGCKRGTTAETVLSRKGINYSVVNDFPALVDGLRKGNFQAVVHDEIVAKNSLGKDSSLKVESLSFARQQYGFAVPEESPLLEELNRSLLELKDSGKYELIKSAWPDLP
jgi:polar amino acid transport system substrate-binding protein